jgi:hypothetical protein
VFEPLAGRRSAGSGDDSNEFPLNIGGSIAGLQDGQKAAPFGELI